MTERLHAKILREGRIAIPKELIEKYKLEEGGFVLFEEEEKSIRIIPAIVVEK